jgi:hypothetical protein
MLLLEKKSPNKGRHLRLQKWKCIEWGGTWGSARPNPIVSALLPSMHKMCLASPLTECPSLHLCCRLLFSVKYLRAKQGAYSERFWLLQWLVLPLCSLVSTTSSKMLQFAQLLENTFQQSFPAFKCYFPKVLTSACFLSLFFANLIHYIISPTTIPSSFQS